MTEVRAFQGSENAESDVRNGVVFGFFFKKGLENVGVALWGSLYG